MVVVCARNFFFSLNANTHELQPKRFLFSWNFIITLFNHSFLIALVFAEMFDAHLLADLQSAFRLGMGRHDFQLNQYNCLFFCFFLSEQTRHVTNAARI